MIVVRNLSKIFFTHQGQEHPAVNGLELHIRRGEIYGLLGPNGAGKTTTLRMLAGLMQPTAGEICIDGALGSEPLALKQRCGFLTASTGLYARLTPREILTYFGALRGIAPEILQPQVRELVESMGLRDFADRRCEGLSTGERQRVQIARTLIGNPPVLILDEPTAGLDVLSNRVILDFVRRAGEQGRTIVLSTHHLDEVEQVCTRFGLLHRGRLLAEGTLAELQSVAGKQRLSDVFLALVEGAETSRALPVLL